MGGGILVWAFNYNKDGFEVDFTGGVADRSRHYSRYLDEWCNRHYSSGGSDWITSVKYDWIPNLV